MREMVWDFEILTLFFLTFYIKFGNIGEMVQKSIMFFYVLRHMYSISRFREMGWKL